MPAMIIGFYFYFYSRRNIFNTIQYAVTQSRQQMQLRLEHVLKMQDRQIINAVMEFDIEELLRAPPPMSEHFQLVNTVRDKISKIMSNDIGMDSFILINLSNNWILTTDGIYDISNMPARQYLPFILEGINNVTWYSDFIDKNNIVLTYYNRWFMSNTIKLIRTCPILGQEILRYISVISVACFISIVTSSRRSSISSSNLINLPFPILASILPI